MRDNLDMFPKGIMESIINPYQGNQSEVGDLKVGTLEYKAEAQFQPLHCNYLFSQMELKFYNYLYIYIYIYIYIFVSKSTRYRRDR